MAQHVVLIPGMLCDTAALGVLPDKLDNGWSVRVVQPSFVSVEAACASILADAPDQFAIVGFSLGGIVAMECAVRAPQRITKVALISASPYAPTSAQRKQWTRWHAELDRGRFKTVVDQANMAMFAPNQSSAFLSKALDMAVRVGPAALALQLQLQASRCDLTSTLPEIGAPTLVLSGCLDPLCPPDYQRTIAAGIPRSRLVLLDRCGHLPFLERPGVSARIVRSFLDGGDVRDDRADHSRLDPTC